jgi:hypothetical protein
MLALLEIAAWLACAIAAGAVASGKGRSPVIWFLLGLLFGPLGLILAVLRKGREHFVRERALARGLVRPCPACEKAVWAKAESCPHCAHAVGPLQ